MFSYWLLWITARGAAAGDGNDVSLFTHLSGLDANSSCSLVSLTRTDGCYSLAACEDHTESGDQWCHTEVANDTELDTSTPGNKNLECDEYVMFVTSPYESWLYRIQPTNFTFLKVRPFKRAKYVAFAFSSARIYFCTRRGINMIGSSDLDGANQTIHVKYIYCFDLAADDINSIVFFVGLAKPVGIISRVKEVGYEILKRFRRLQPISIAAHPGSKTLFVAFYKKITSVDYNGTNFTILGEDRTIHSITLVPSSDVLYFGTEMGLYSFNIKTRKRFEMPITFPDGWTGVKKCVYAYNRVIISCEINPYIIIFDPKTKDFNVHQINKAYTVPFFILRECYSK